MPILKLFVGGGVPDAPADFAWLQFGVLDGIYDGVVGRGLDPSFAILLLLKVARGVEDAAPYTRPYGGCRGEQCSPVESCVAAKHYGRIWNPPLRQSKISAPEGSIGEGRKSVKKRAALLHVLAFSCLDLPFGVPRGE